MRKKKHLARISCTIPSEILAKADQIAQRQERSRSWVITQALRYYSNVEGEAGTYAKLRDPGGAAYASEEVAESRRGHLRHTLTLSPEDRLARAEELMALARLVRPRAQRMQVIGFDTIEDFQMWKTTRRPRL